MAGLADLVEDLAQRAMRRGGEMGDACGGEQSHGEAHGLAGFGAEAFENESGGEFESGIGVEGGIGSGGSGVVGEFGDETWVAGAPTMNGGTVKAKAVGNDGIWPASGEKRDGLLLDGSEAQE